MSAFDHIAIIYNPNSTGDAPQLAETLATEINDSRVIGISATLTPTERAGHAIDLARDIALSHARPLIVSVSGDGGYNEVVNGAMLAKKQTKTVQPVVAVLAAGNANDHRRVMRDEPLINLIERAEIKSFDLVKLTAHADNFDLTRYAHSYIGFGITPEVGNELNKSSKNLWSEIRMILKTYRIYAPFRINRDGKELLLDNLIFANINEMAKVIKLDEKNTVRDGRFEVIALPHRSKLHMFGTLIRAAVIGFKDVPSFQTYDLKTFDALPIQLDGEIEKLPENCAITVTSEKHAIDSLF